MNKLTITGTIQNGFITTTRLSGTQDTLPINSTAAGYFTVEGSLHTYNTPDRHLKIYVQPDAIQETTAPEQNTITLSGYICKTPTYRRTPSGKRISDIILAVNRADGRSDYIPCVAWGTVADEMSTYIIGSAITINGRVQSRTHHKGVAYEVCITKLSVDREREEE